jgi:hypothetical protein
MSGRTCRMPLKPSSVGAVPSDRWDGMVRRASWVTYGRFGKPSVIPSRQIAKSKGLRRRGNELTVNTTPSRCVPWHDRRVTMRAMPSCRPLVERHTWSAANGLIRWVVTTSPAGRGISGQPTPATFGGTPALANARMKLGRSNGSMDRSAHASYASSRRRKQAFH